MVTQLVVKLSRSLDEKTLSLGLHRQYYEGGQPLAFLNPADREALKNRLVRLPVNYCRHAIETLADVLVVEGFTTDDASVPDLGLWQLWRRAGMVEKVDEAIRNALIFGRCPVIVWSAPGGVTVSVESPTSCVVAGGVALKRWQADDLGHAVLYGPDEVVRLVTVSPVPVGGVLPSGGWRVVERIPHNLGRLPVVELVHHKGTSALADIEPLVDALTKIMSDAMVTAEYTARPRRFTIGLDIKEDADGNPINPFTEGPLRVHQLEGDPQSVKYDQLDAAPLTPYTDLATQFIHIISALAAIPPHLSGIRQDQPASAEALRAAESQRSGRARSCHRMFGSKVSELVGLIYEISTGKPAPNVTEPLWTDPETSSPAQAADAAVKLVQAGILSIEGALDKLGYSPEAIAQERTRRRASALDTAALGALRGTL